MEGVGSIPTARKYLCDDNECFLVSVVNSVHCVCVYTNTSKYLILCIGILCIGIYMKVKVRDTV